MSDALEKTEVMCPMCGEVFDDWFRPSFDPATSSTCPTCGYELARDRSLHQDHGGETVTDDFEVVEYQ
ncbi:MAG: hypothetical protein P8Y93_01810 [Acidobacteriota bacterium]|jgi:transposase